MRVLTKEHFLETMDGVVMLRMIIGDDARKSVSNTVYDHLMRTLHVQIWNRVWTILPHIKGGAWNEIRQP